MSEQNPASFFEQRMLPIGLTEENNKISLLQAGEKVGDPNFYKEFQIFTETEQGINILVYTLNRGLIPFGKNGSRHKINNYSVTRLKEPKIKPNGDVQKYAMPSGVPTVPFFPPALIDKYDKKTEIPVLYITEGYFKAFMASLHGIDCIGVPSITCLKNSETNKLHDDIVQLVNSNKIQRIVWLTDGDCLNISRKQFTKEPEGQVYKDDLTKRPRVFYSSISTFYDLTSQLECKKYFAHINSDQLEGHPKGLDDMLIEFKDDIKEILKDFHSFEKVSSKKYEGDYVVKFDISMGLGVLNKYFMLNDVNVFYLYHLEKNPELKNRYFKWYGTQYLYNDKEGICEVKVPKSASDYFRVGDKYYKHITVPNRYNEDLKAFHRREKATIKDDHGNDIFKFIPKYEAFCVVPDHMNYQRVLNSCFNLYAPFEHEIEEGECENTLEFIKHIFGEEKVSFVDGDNGVQEYSTYDLGMDYLSILFKKPQHILPILCLVSKERSTGKTTFAKWLNQIFTENMAVVGNDDLENSFNSHWSSKLIICCDETKIDKHKVVERVKSLSTASSIMMNAKGKDQVTMEFFGKFIFLSNNEDNFVNIDSQEIRFWIHKVPVIQKKNVDLLEVLIDEIPAFLNYISKRKLVTAKRERHWFHNDLLKTEALQKVVKNSLPGVQKTINAHITDLFEEFEDVNVLTLPFNYITDTMLRKKYDDWYVRRIIKEDMNLVLQPTQKRHYPRMKEEHVEGVGMTRRAELVHFHGRYYEFLRGDYCKETIDDLPF